MIKIYFHVQSASISCTSYRHALYLVLKYDLSQLALLKDGHFKIKHWMGMFAPGK